MAQIYVDGEALFRKPDGVGRYTQRLISSLVSIDGQNSYTAIGMAGDQLAPRLISDKYSGLDYKYLPIPRKVYNYLYKHSVQINVDRFLRKPIDLTIYPNFVTKPKIATGKKILVIHDLAYLRTPDVIEQKNLKYMRRWVPRSIKRADLVVAVSQTTKEELINLLDIKPKKIRVVENAVDDRFFAKPNKTELRRVAEKFHLDEKFLLHVGTIEPRKNQLNLLIAYEQLPKAVRDEFPLVMVGGQGWNYDAILSKIQQLKNDKINVRVLGKVDDADLPGIYHSASAFALPSSYEGFGLPLIEAMAAGLPTITSELAPMTEIAGQAALLVDPDSVDSISVGLVKILTNEKVRSDLNKAAPKQARQFNWNNSAKKMQQVIEELL
ncbi:MAG: glycosyltransferase family 1 protein [Candidatus Saccharimonadales bacterium]|nr:glycosyltransferase family 1 protein [Candidatus Saccharimonadales bacterium]